MAKIVGLCYMLLSSIANYCFDQNQESGLESGCVAISEMFSVVSKLLSIGL